MSWFSWQWFSYSKSIRTIREGELEPILEITSRVATLDSSSSCSRGGPGRGRRPVEHRTYERDNGYSRPREGGSPRRSFALRGGSVQKVKTIKMKLESISLNFGKVIFYLFFNLKHDFWEIVTLDFEVWTLDFEKLEIDILMLAELKLWEMFLSLESSHLVFVWLFQV